MTTNAPHHYDAYPDSTGRYPIERKTTVGAVATYVSMLVLLVASDAFSTHGPALAYLPGWLAPIVVGIVPAASSFAASWLTKHQRRGTLAEQPNIIGPDPYLGEETPNERPTPPGAHKRAPGPPATG